LYGIISRLLVEAQARDVLGLETRVAFLELGVPDVPFLKKLFSIHLIKTFPESLTVAFSTSH
jgi:hypothetical protein